MIFPLNHLCLLLEYILYIVDFGCLSLGVTTLFPQPQLAVPDDTIILLDASYWLKLDI